MTALGRLRTMRLTIRLRLLVGFGVLVASIAVVIAVAIAGMGSMRTAHRTVANRGLPKELADDALMTKAVDMHYSEAVYALDHGTSRADYLADRQTFQQGLDRLDALANPGNEDADADDAIVTAVKAFDRGDARIWADVRAGDIAGAYKLIRGPQDAAADALADALTEDRNGYARVVRAETAHFDSVASTAKLAMIVVGSAALLLAVAIGLALARRVGLGVDRAKQRLEEIAEAVASRLKPGLEALAAGDLTVALETKTKADVSYDNDELGDIMRTTERMRGAIVDCYTAYNRSTEKLRGLVGQVSSTAARVDKNTRQMAVGSEQADKATTEIAQAIEHVASGAERQVQMIDSARRAADEVAAAVTESAEHAEQTAEVATRARKVVEQGVGAAEQANDAMRSVRDSSQAVTDAIQKLAVKSGQIGQIVQTITAIAEQTNLLALNAAIEAARAGDQGRGFAVVAEEVRKLAEESQHAAGEISQLIGAIQTETSAAVRVVEEGARETADGASVVEQAREAFVSIGQAVDDMTSRVEQIAAAVALITTSATSMQTSINEAAAVAEESSAATEEVSASTQETSASTQQIAASATEIAGTADMLRALVGRFQVAIDDGASGQS